jgi:hypothetical protein
LITVGAPTTSLQLIASIVSALQPATMIMHDLDGEHAGFGAF